MFKAAAEGGAVPLVVIGVLSSAIAAFFYIRVIVLMFFSEPRPEGPTVAVPSPLTMTAIGVGVAVTVVLGVAPQYFLGAGGRRGGVRALTRRPPGDTAAVRYLLGGCRTAAVARGRACGQPRGLSVRTPIVEAVVEGRLTGAR
ncbi:NAD(P)H-quinone oxidoreductase subunit 2, chloroplastic [Streptomyces griseomycini]